MATADETTLNSGSGGDEIDEVDVSSSPLIKRQVVAIGDGVGATRANYGSVSANGNLGVSPAKDQGRTYVAFTVDWTEGVTTEAFSTMIINAGGTTTSSTNYTVPSGKTLRLQNFSTSVKLTSATMVNARGYLLGVTSGGTLATTSPVLDEVVISPNVAATSAAGFGETDYPDGLELPAGSIIGMAQVTSSTACSVTLSLLGYIYPGQ